MTTDEQRDQGDGSGPRYCAACGETCVDADGDRCPHCRSAWSPRSFADVRSLATLLTELRWLREDGLIDDASYDAARSLYERRLARVRSTPAPPESHLQQPRSGRSLVGLLRGVLDPDATDGATPGAALPPAPPTRPPRPTLGEWAAARQADILLYLGAFILSIAALIFVSYQGEALAGGIRFGVLLLYTAAFLVLGLLLPRWDRVREAGPVFLALGAILVAVNFIALRVRVLGGERLPDDVLWLLGGSATAVLYLLLALRGFGRWYALPGVLALVVAWGALGALTGAGVLQAVGFDAVWLTYPALAASASILAARPWWSHREPYRDLGWPYLLAIAVLVPVAATPFYADAPAHGWCVSRPAADATDSS